MSYAVATHDLTKRFGQVHAVERLNLDIPEGAMFGLVGPNGAGKTTTIKIMMNILRATGGRAEVLGIDSRRLSPADLTGIGYVSENQKMPDWMTVRYLMNYLAPFYPNWDDALASEMLREFDLPPDRPLGKMSRGMRMKAALASSLAYHPRLMVLDEPFSGLDPLVRDEFIEGLLERAAGATVLISSHDLAEMETFITHIAYIENGRLQFADEMSNLAARFREVEVTIDDNAQRPASWPEHWLRPEMSPAVVRFVDSRFDQERTTSEIATLFPGAKNVEVNALPLRSIFVALARSSRRTE